MKTMAAAISRPNKCIFQDVDAEVLEIKKEWLYMN